MIRRTIILVSAVLLINLVSPKVKADIQPNRLKPQSNSNSTILLKNKITSSYPDTNELESLQDSEQSLSLNHTFLISGVSGININTKMQKMGSLKYSTNISSSNGIELSYLYNITDRLQIGAGFMHMYLSGTSLIADTIDTMSVLAETQFLLIKKENFSFYVNAGYGISFNTANLKYHRLTYTKVSSNYNNNQLNNLRVIPVLDGTIIPDSVAEFYCSPFKDFSSNLDKQVIRGDHKKGDDQDISVFFGKGFGLCLTYQKPKDSSKSNDLYVLESEPVVVTKNAVSVPYFLGVGFDYDLSHIINHIYYDNSPISEKSPTSYKVGISVNLRYFDNGKSNFSLDNSSLNSKEIYTIQYGGSMNFSIGLYLKI